ncbi:16S rRNA (cytosine(967)-C(5))-methyltransferase RsmB [Luteolibacter pohnpeiensis]|uniref:16S rRNA (cytosine(967)-C(5))-methyltransferase n=1 Tax=Luteolibacter pohnpeiensis TaxID=454153 RepID=A0A934S213_9BACT|nr:16S rRNA (cytosine(967)-C(5))-methyltransferase RsmB [Luteolibacter pohnpeiensis]MBK1881755.1 16S rRNA (cytosine(967)-C(5))-methyltransferase RsmB [Luteolibacter pohnpeiensis]
MPAKNFHVRQAAVSALRAWAKGHDYAETLIDRHAQRRMLSAADRGLLQAILFGVLRHRRLLDHWIGKLRDGKLDPETRDILRVGLCQLIILQIPEHAAVNETVEAGKASVRSLINAVLRRAVSSRKRLLEEIEDLPPAMVHSHPDWLYKRWRASFGKNAAIELMEWDNTPAQVFFRLNPLAEPLENIPGSPVEGAPGFYQLSGPIPTPLIASGQIYIQDPATRHAVDLLAPKPGERILDACAAPGGKAFLIAAALGSAENLVCTDSNEKRLPRLQQNLERLHAGTAETSVHDWTKPAPESWHGAFDGILLDVPCSNTGVIRRRVDVRWRLQAPDIEKLVNTQRKILENALPCLKPGGRLVYSTCSIEAQENLEQVESFLAAHPDLKLIGTRDALPFRDHTDGSFAALIQ